MPSRRVDAVLAVLVLLAAVATAVVLAQRSCPPPSWASWLVTEGSEPGRVNVACVVSDG